MTRRFGMFNHDGEARVLDAMVDFAFNIIKGMDRRLAFELLATKMRAIKRVHSEVTDTMVREAIFDYLVTVLSDEWVDRNADDIYTAIDPQRIP